MDVGAFFFEVTVSMGDLFLAENFLWILDFVGLKMQIVLEDALHGSIRAQNLFLADKFGFFAMIFATLILDVFLIFHILRFCKGIGKAYPVFCNFLTL